MDADVLVLGAGFAGITAARDLRDAGRRTIVMEGRDRIGGRTWYRRMPGTHVHVEYGGMFFSRSSQPHLAAEIERYGVAVASVATSSTVAWIRGHERHEGPSAFERIREALAKTPLADAVARTAEAVLAQDRRVLGELDVPAAEWIASLEADDEAADYLRAFAAAMGGATIEEFSALTLLWDMAEHGYDPVDAFLEMGEVFAAGTKSLIDAMAQGLEVRFGAVVRRVERDADGVRVTLADGATLEAPMGIVALPLNVWADVAFEPALAPAKQRAAGEGHVGRSAKVLAVVRNAPERFMGVGWGTPMSAVAVTGSVPEGGLLVGFSAQDPVDLTDHDAMARAVLAYLPDATIIATDGHDWVTDPFSKGTWLATPPGWFADGVTDALEQPEGRLAFAGSDIASEGAGWIEGAVASGRAAAAWAGREVSRVLR